MDEKCWYVAVIPATVRLRDPPDPPENHSTRASRTTDGQASTARNLMKPAPRVWVLPNAHTKPLPAFHPLLGSILANRGFTDETAAQLLDPRPVVHDPKSLKGMPEAVDAIAAAIKDKKRLAVYGDFDADGVTATALLVTALKAAGVDCIPYIPDRQTEGYGLHTEALDELHAAGVDMVVSVDCGTASADVAEARPAGLQLVVTDHHLAVPVDGQYNLPKVEALVNPKQPGEGYEFPGLAGVGVAWKLLQALEEKGIVPEGFARARTWLALIGTIGDVMPLQDENRTIVREGLEQLRTNPPPGIRALAELAGITSDLTAMDLAFSIVPRINAAGRMEDAYLALKLLMATTMAEARPLAKALEVQNQRRRAAVDVALAEAEKMVAKMPDNTPAIVVGSPNWPMGIVGLVAGRLAERYGRPAFALALTTPEAKGSARSAGGVHVVDALSDARSTVIRFGGHAPAAGFAVDPARFPAFRKAVMAACAKQIGSAPRQVPVVIDAVISATDLTLPLTALLDRLEPTGSANRQPTLALMDTRIMGVYPFGAEITTACATPNCPHTTCTKGDTGWVRKQHKHTRLLIRGGDGNLVSVVAWNSPDLPDKVHKGDREDLAFSVSIDEWKGQRRLQLRLIDEHPATLRISTRQRGPSPRSL